LVLLKDKVTHWLIYWHEDVTSDSQILEVQFVLFRHMPVVLN